MHEPLNILIVEDTPEDAELVIRQLKKDGLHFSFTNVTTASEFIFALETFSPHVVLSDHTLPQFNSWEALRIAREYDRHIPFILVTGTVSEEFAVDILHAGADDYILKSSLTRLSNAIQNALQRRKGEKEYLRMVEELRRSEDRLAAFMNNSPAMQWIKDESGRYVFVNRFLLSRMNLDPGRLNELPAMLDRQVVKRLEEIDRHVRDTGRPVEMIENFRGKDGKPHYLLMSEFPMPNDHLGGIAFDVTAQKLAEEKLRMINEELNTFIYKASHDLKGPLSSIMGLANLVKTELTDPQAVKYIEMIAESTQKLDKILLGLIEVMSAKRYEAKSDLIDFNQVIGEVLRSLEFMPGFNRIRFQVEVMLEKDFFSDRSSLTSIFQNLIENAVKYQDKREPEPYLHIRIQDERNGVRIQCSDNGLGISKEIRGKVFDMFFRGSEDSKGSGLGLYIIRNSIEKLGGTIVLEDEYVKGCCFSLWLPCSK